MDYLERKFGRYAIPNLMKIIATGMAMIFAVSFIFPDTAYYFDFSAKLVMQGEVWRIITFIFVPERQGWTIVFYLILLVVFSDLIEGYYGALAVNLYFFMGSLGVIIANIILESMFQMPIPVYNQYLYLSLLLVAATVAPDNKIYMYFIIPISYKWLGIIYGLLMVYNFISSPIGNQILIGFSLLNLVLFLFVYFAKKGKRAFRGSSFDTKVKRAEIKKAKNSGSKIIEVAFHCCEVCGKTEKDDRSLDFRYCSKCKGMHEYCDKHIREHEHILED